MKNTARGSPRGLHASEFTLAWALALAPAPPLALALSLALALPLALALALVLALALALAGLAETPGAAEPRLVAGPAVTAATLCAPLAMLPLLLLVVVVVALVLVVGVPEFEAKAETAPAPHAGTEPFTAEEWRGGGACGMDERGAADDVEKISRPSGRKAKRLQATAMMSSRETTRTGVSLLMG